MIEQIDGNIDDPLWVGADEQQGASLDAFGALSLLATNEHWRADGWRFLLDSARVGDRQLHTGE